MRKIVKMSFERKNHAGNGQMNRRYLILKKWTPGIGMPPPRGNYTCILQQYSKIFFSETAWQIRAKLQVEERMNVYINGQGQMTKMAAMAMNSKKKIFKNLLQNQKAYDFETWYETSSNGGLQNVQNLRILG